MCWSSMTSQPSLSSSAFMRAAGCDSRNWRSGCATTPRDATVGVDLALESSEAIDCKGGEAVGNHLSREASTFLPQVRPSALLTAALAVTLARIRPNPVPSTLPRRPRFLLRPAANHPIPSRTHFPVRRRAGALLCGSDLRAEPNSCALLFPQKLPPFSQPG